MNARASTCLMEFQQRHHEVTQGLTQGQIPPILSPGFHMQTQGSIPERELIQMLQSQINAQNTNHFAQHEQSSGHTRLTVSSGGQGQANDLIYSQRLPDETGATMAIADGSNAAVRKKGRAETGNQVTLNDNNYRVSCFCELYIP